MKKHLSTYFTAWTFSFVNENGPVLFQVIGIKIKHIINQFKVTMRIMQIISDCSYADKNTIALNWTKLYW